jgi:NADPH:quinone reductase-like Zn-dependent oxidoreductase
VSTAAVQLAKWLGATVIGTSRTAAKLEQARSLGLDHGIDTSRGEFASQINGAVDVILDYFGGPALGENLSVLASRGRLVVLGTLQGAEAKAVNVGVILRSRLEIIGTVMRARPHEERAALVEEFAARVLPELKPGGLLRPVVGEVFAMDEIAEAHRAMEANRVFGKIVLRW